MVGADAVAAGWFINKIGTRQLACTAVWCGTLVYVVASRDKLAHSLLAERLRLRDGNTEEVWADPTAGVRVCNPYFEKISLDLAAGIVTDIGVVGPATWGSLRGWRSSMASRALRCP